MAGIICVWVPPSAGSMGTSFNIGVPGSPGRARLTGYWLWNPGIGSDNAAFESACIGHSEQPVGTLGAASWAEGRRLLGAFDEAYLAVFGPKLSSRTTRTKLKASVVFAKLPVRQRIAGRAAFLALGRTLRRVGPWFDDAHCHCKSDPDLPHSTTHPLALRPRREHPKPRTELSEH